MKLRINRHDKIGQNFLTRPDPIRKIPDSPDFFLPEVKIG